MIQQYKASLIIITSLWYNLLLELPDAQKKKRVSLFQSPEETRSGRAELEISWVVA